MTDLLMLVCASIGSMAFGILAAYWVLRLAFLLIRPPQRPAKVKAQPEVIRGL
jgi:hypothetical protein